MAEQFLSLFFDEEDDPNGWRPTRPKRGRFVDQDSKEFNRAILDLIEGRGGAIRNLAMITGLSEDGIKCRINRARWDDKPEEHEGETQDLSPSETRYFELRYSKSSDPSVREFMGRMHSMTRRRPDWRSAKDRDVA